MSKTLNLCIEKPGGIEKKKKKSLKKENRHSSSITLTIFNYAIVIVKCKNNEPE